MPLISKNLLNIILLITLTTQIVALSIGNFTPENTNDVKVTISYGSDLPYEIWYPQQEYIIFGYLEKVFIYFLLIYIFGLFFNYFKQKNFTTDQKLHKKI